MAKQPVEVGPVGERIAANLVDLRRERRLGQQQLAERLGELGRLIRASAVSKIETGERRVDVDDLVAFAVALEVTPNRLLLPGDAGAEETGLTPTVTVSSLAAWRWACGEAPLDGDAVRFRRENRPHRPGDQALTVHEVEQHRDVIAPVIDAVRAARAAGVPLGKLLSYVQLVQAGEMLRERDGEHGQG